MSILYGIIIMFVGVMLVVKSEWMLNNFGRVNFFEEYLGTSGGSRLGYKLLGMIIIFIGLLVMTNMIGGFLQWMLSPLTRYSQ